MKSYRLLLLLLLVAPCAHAQIWECTDPQSGAKELNNDPASAKHKHCIRKNVGPMNTVPSPAPRATAPAAAGQQRTPNFPSVGSDTQRQRDGERRKILEQELGQEQIQLDNAKKQLAEQQEVRFGNEKNYARVEDRLRPFEARVRQHEINIESLRKELGNIR